MADLRRADKMFAGIGYHRCEDRDKLMDAEWAKELKTNDGARLNKHIAADRYGFARAWYQEGQNNISAAMSADEMRAAICAAEELRKELF